MIEKIFKLKQTDNKVIEKVIVNDHLHYMHAIFPQHEGLPLHQSNANVYMTVLRGKLSIGLNDEDVKIYAPMTVLSIPFNTKMNVRNEHSDILEIIIFKTPAPGDFYK
ncbi:MAG TPA: hypothetical protein GX695_02835 [Acholeplasmataceae bacterium]|nr:hypothetical protein [Acholeplasmataceae bacterium]